MGPLRKQMLVLKEDFYANSISSMHCINILCYKWVLGLNFWQCKVNIYSRCKLNPHKLILN